MLTFSTWCSFSVCCLYYRTTADLKRSTSNQCTAAGKSGNMTCIKVNDNFVRCMLLPFHWLRWITPSRNDHAGYRFRDREGVAVSGHSARYSTGWSSSLHQTTTYYIYMKLSKLNPLCKWIPLKQTQISEFHHGRLWEFMNLPSFFSLEISCRSLVISQAWHLMGLSFFVCCKEIKQASPSGRLLHPLSG
jgi:hypothetical protein